MKTLYVKDFLRQVKGELVQGRKEDVVQHAVTHPSGLQDRTLLFDLDQKAYQFENQLLRFPHTVIVTEEPRNYLGKERWTIIYVPDIEEAFQRFVHFYRSLWDIPVMGVTGTCGKTTVKEMIAHILTQAKLQVQSTYKSMNSLDRNFRYLVGIDEQTQAAVIEMGVACPDDILYSCSFFQPQIGIITTIGIDHLQHCGTQENYIREKGKLLQGMDNQGILILNGDDQNIRKIDLSRFRGRIVRFGLSKDADYCARDLQYVKNGMAFSLYKEGGVYKAFVPGYGQHNVYNALAACAAVNAVGIRTEKAIEHLRSFRHVESHLEVRTGMNGCTVIDDTWSSNPTSAEAALKVLSEVSNGRKTVALLGEMGLLGDYTETYHALLGEKVVQYQVDGLITIDKTAELIGKQAAKLGMPKNRIFRCESSNQLTDLFHKLLDKNTVILVKTSMLDSRTDFIKRILLRGKNDHGRA